MRMVDKDDFVLLYRYSPLLQVRQRKIPLTILADSGSIFPGGENQQQPTDQKSDPTQRGDNTQRPDP